MAGMPVVENPYRVLRVNRFATGPEAGLSYNSLIKMICARKGIDGYLSEKDEHALLLADAALEILHDPARKAARDRVLLERHESLYLFPNMDSALEFYGLQAQDVVIATSRPSLVTHGDQLQKIVLGRDGLEAWTHKCHDEARTLLEEVLHAESPESLFGVYTMNKPVFTTLGWRGPSATGTQNDGFPIKRSARGMQPFELLAVALSCTANGYALKLNHP